MEEEDVLHGASPLPPQTHSRPGQRASPLSGRSSCPPLAQGGRGLVQSLHNRHLVILAWREWGGTLQPFMFFPRVGSSRPLVAFASSLHCGVIMLFLLLWSYPGDSPRLCLAGTC